MKRRLSPSSVLSLDDAWLDLQAMPPFEPWHSLRDEEDESPVAASWQHSLAVSISETESSILSDEMSWTPRSNSTIPPELEATASALSHRPTSSAINSWQKVNLSRLSRALILSAHGSRPIVSDVASHRSSVNPGKSNAVLPYLHIPRCELCGDMDYFLTPQLRKTETTQNDGCGSSNRGQIFELVPLLCTCRGYVQTAKGGRGKQLGDEVAVGLDAPSAIEQLYEEVLLEC